MLYRPIVRNQEVKFSQKKFIISKTDVDGNIIFVNENFTKISGYTAEELKGVPHNVLRHPDMPQAIFYLMWKSLLAGMEVSAVIKNLAKSGHYYWVIADFSMERDNYGKLSMFSSFNRVAPEYVKEEIEPLYEEMIRCERKGGLEGSLTCLEEFLMEGKMGYNEYLEELIKPKGIVNKFISNFKELLN